jgi:hypothetical protein
MVGRLSMGWSISHSKVPSSISLYSVGKSTRARESLRNCVRLVLTFESKFTRVDCLFPTGKEYARADYRWGVSDPTVVALEILTVLGAAPMCCYTLMQLIRNDPARHYWIIVLSTAELYGG